MNVFSRSIPFLLLFGVIGLLLFHFLVHLLTESWWFHSVGFSQVFWTPITWQLGLGIVTFVLYSLSLWANYRLAIRWTQELPLQEWGDSGINMQAISDRLVLGAIALVSWIAATATAPSWETVLKFLHPSQFGIKDPIFQHDVGYYVFHLPFYQGVWTWFFVLLLLELGIAATVYGLSRAGLQLQDWQRYLQGGAKTHLGVLLAAIAALMAIHFWLKRYDLLYGSDGVVFGIGYTDAHARLFAYTVLSWLAVGVAIALLMSIWRRGLALSLRAIGLFILSWFVLSGLVPWAQQQFFVAPNELTAEKPYLQNNIQFTQNAYRLHDVQRQNYAAQAQLNLQALQENQPTIRNIRLWDYRPLLSTYRQLQEIRLYYKFSDVDIDRYTLNDAYQQVMLSGRELAYDQLPQEAKTWVNQRLKYTHGYGLVMSPVNRVTSDGLPNFYIKDIPPVSTINLPVNQPRIYYGQETGNYIFTGTKTEEFDYPQGEANTFTTYTGTGGVPLPSFWQRLIYAIDRGSIQILISNYFTNQSRIHYHRQIQDRVRHITPFLRFDSDPYLTLIDGRLQWILDAYTVSDRYPYSEPVSRSKNIDAILNDNTIATTIRGNVNYIRNSVKVVIDAYNGTVQYFAMDESDPVLNTYRQIFPQLFTPAAAVPPALKAHFRYPEDLFKIQAQMYLSYHMSNPEAYYNREDLWKFPVQTYEGNEQVMQPYYVVMRLPDTQKEEFILILPFTPSNKDNMIAWMAARSNGQEYGKLLLYEFPKQSLVYGPRQIEARIDQDPQISQQFTLWSQAGSKVIRGDLLVIPIARSLLYVEPVYLRAEQGELPQLKRVIVAYDKAITMQETLEQSLAAIFGSGQAPAPGTPAPVTGATAALARSALEAYQRADAALRQGNWADYGRYQNELQRILQQMNQ